MNRRKKAVMADEESAQPQLRQRRSKIIIRKCKKPPGSKQTKPADDNKKVNGELSAEKKGKEGENVVELDTVKAKVVSDVSVKGKKRKLSATEEEDEVIILEDFTSAETQHDENELNDSSDKGICTVALQESGKPNRNSKVLKTSKARKKALANGKKGGKKSGDGAQNDSQAEYAQYLGLQPTMQFKCYRCGEKGFPSMLALNMHQRMCEITQKSNFLSNLQQDTTSTDPSMLTNFRITRKVYLCSACGTYYENWNLFLHMREVHKKHICLYCLLLFPTVDKLADHLQNIHGVEESAYKNKEDFENTYKGSCYLVCCSCESMFEETGDYSNHQCVRVERIDPTAKCNLCGVKCGHYYTCPNNNQSRAVTTVTSVTQPLPTTKAQPSATITKFVVPVSPKKVSEEIWMGKKETSFHDDDYDISDIASFCHVDIADESGGKDKVGSEENPVELSDEDNKDTSSSPSTSEPHSVQVQKRKKDNSVSIEDTDRTENSSVNDDTGQNISCDEADQGSKIEESKEEAEDSCDKNPTVGEHPNETSKKELEEKDMEKSDSGNEAPSSKSSDLDKNCTEKGTDAEFSNEKSGFESASPEDQTTLNIDGEKQIQDINRLHPPVQTDNENLAVSDSNKTAHLSRDDTKLPIDENSKEGSEVEEKSLMESSKTGVLDEISSQKSNDALNESPNTSNNDTNATENLDEASKNELSVPDDPNDSRINTVNESSKDFNLADIIGVNSSIIELNRGRLVKRRKKKPVKVDKKNKTINPEQNSTNIENNDLPNKEEPLSQIVAEELSDGIFLAGEDVLAMALTLEDKLEEASPQAVIKECVRTSCLNCVYCSHAVKIAVNGKQLALHLLAEHRYKPVKNNETTQDVVKKLKNSLNDLESVFFNTDSYDSSDKSLNVIYDYTYECFQCRFVAKVHKDLYSHKRKMHQKVVMLCIMCKSNFFSYSELLCHMCPGVYASENINFRCCFCNLDMIPSAFRLMVHLRKSHHTCDICLEVADDQQKLSIHMWKHKLNHMCYRCGIAYRNKPDITKHLFWKHGTESILCKKCLQKKWPHVYHFCVPPTVFICEECNTSFSKAVALKVHKRFHSGELLYECSKCDQKFVSRKLQKKHEEAHDRPIETLPANQVDSDGKLKDSTEEHINVESVDELDTVSISRPVTQDSKVDEEKPDISTETKIKKKKKKERKVKDSLDVYDLPPLNLSSESDSSDDETTHLASDVTEEKKDEPVSEVCQPSKSAEKTECGTSDQLDTPDENQVPPPVVDGVWDNFKTYKAELEKRETKDLLLPNSVPSSSSGELEKKSTKDLSTLPDSLPSTSYADQSTQPSTSKASDHEEKLNKEILSAYNWFLTEHNYFSPPSKPKTTAVEVEGVEDLAAAGDCESKAEELQSVPAPREHSSSIDHAYATPSNTSGEGTIATLPDKSAIIAEEAPSTPVKTDVPPAETHTSSKKKKQKTPKKKKPDTHSSSSSDSSSDSDSSSCSSKCSGCSDCSGSSSSSSDSDSDSSPEGKERSATQGKIKTEKSKHKHQKEQQVLVPEIPPPPPPAEEEPVVDTSSEPIQLPIRESDLDTDESSTDEDFYDRYPQNHAKEQMEKRNLMLLASVAPTNNGTVSPISSPPSEKPPAPNVGKQKAKSKKRRKSQQNQKTTSKSSKSHQQSHAKPSTSINFPMASSTPSFGSTNYHNLSSKISSPLRTPVTAFHSDATGGSGSENESARLSKRKRVRNKFYGYSSEEEEQQQEKPTLKWRKVETPAPQPQPYYPPMSYQPPSTFKPDVTIPHARRPKPSESSGSDDEPPLQIQHKENTSSSSSSSSSSDSESELDSKHNVPKEQTEKSDNLYCYCQCPYDEVSEMIACDGEDCTIEWFHFECVGIMVPPKGKWFCPDCRKRREMM